MTRVRFAFAALVALILAGAAGLVAPAPAAAQKPGGTLTIVRPTDPVSLDPQLETTAPGAWVYFNMLEPLLTIDEKMQIRLSLASSYEVMSPTKVRFKLRPGVKFHDGTPLNAAAVKFTFERALRGNPPARWASLAGPLPKTKRRAAISSIRLVVRPTAHDAYVPTLDRPPVSTPKEGI